MGGLRKKMPITAGTCLISSPSLMGIPPLAGFFSKDEIIASVGNNGYTLVHGGGPRRRLPDGGVHGRRRSTSPTAAGATKVPTSTRPPSRSAVPAVALAHAAEPMAEEAGGTFVIAEDRPPTSSYWLGSWPTILTTSPTVRTPTPGPPATPRRRPTAATTNTSNRTSRRRSSPCPPSHPRPPPSLTARVPQQRQTPAVGASLHSNPKFTSGWSHESAGQPRSPSLVHPRRSTGARRGSRRSAWRCWAPCCRTSCASPSTSAPSAPAGLTRPQQGGGGGLLVPGNKYYLDALYENVVVAGIKGPMARLAVLVQHGGPRWRREWRRRPGQGGIAARHRVRSEGRRRRGQRQGTGGGGERALRPVQSGKVQQYGALLFGAAAIGALILVIYRVGARGMDLTDQNWF